MWFLTICNFNYLSIKFLYFCDEKVIEKVGEMFAHFKKRFYLCIAFERKRIEFYKRRKFG